MDQRLRFPEAQRLLIAGLVFGLTYVLGLPALFAALLYRHRAGIAAHDHQLEHWTGFLYECYRPSVFWFELVWIARRLLLAAAVSLLARAPSWSAALIQAVLAASLIVQVKLKPSSRTRWICR